MSVYSGTLNTRSVHPESPAVGTLTLDNGSEVLVARKLCSVSRNEQSLRLKNFESSIDRRPASEAVHTIAHVARSDTYEMGIIEAIVVQSRRNVCGISNVEKHTAK